MISVTFENVILGIPSKKQHLDLEPAKRRLLELCEEYEMYVDPDEIVWRLPVGRQQWVEILKALYRGARILILDEPTAVLTPQETQELFKVIRRLKEDGKSVIIITHKLHETMEIADWVYVMRHGKMIGCVAKKDTSPEELTRMMVDHALEKFEKAACHPGEVALSLSGLSYTNQDHAPVLRDVNLEIREGEIYGLAGIEGNGQQELEEMIVGNRKVTEGSILLNGTPIHTMPVKDRKAMGLGYIPSDRHKNAMISSFSITENFLLGYQKNPQYCKKGFIDYDKLRQDAGKQVEAFEIKIAGVDQEIGQLSGGNQQKVILGREISHDPGLVLVAQPVRGLDIGAIEKVHKTLLELKDQGKAILLISAELSEIMNLSDRIAVFYEGEASAQFTNGEYTKEEIGLFMAGKKQEVNAHEVDM